MPSAISGRYVQGPGPSGIFASLLWPNSWVSASSPNLRPSSYVPGPLLGSAITTGLPVLFLNSHAGFLGFTMPSPFSGL